VVIQNLKLRISSGYDKLTDTSWSVMFVGT